MGQRYRNSEEIARYAATRETRATTPDNYALSNRTNVVLDYDGPSLGWELRARTALDRVVLELPEVPAQESMDDVLALTELRLNAVTLGVGSSGGIRLVPYAQASIDSEFTPTVDPVTEVEAPRQKIFRQALGVVAYPGQYLTEVRLGALVQQDASTSSTHSDAGAVFALKLQVPLMGSAVLSSVADVRYLARDDDDRPEDLELWASWVSKVAMPLNEYLRFFMVADVAAFRGKAPGHRAPANSVVLGGGLDFTFSKLWYGKNLEDTRDR